MPINAELIQLEDNHPLQDLIAVNCVSNNKQATTATSIWTGWARRPSTTASSIEDEDDFFGCRLDEDNRSFFCSPPPAPEEVMPRGSQPSISSSVGQHQRWPKLNTTPGWTQSRDVPSSSKQQIQATRSNIWDGRWLFAACGAGTDSSEALKGAREVSMQPPPMPDTSSTPPCPVGTTGGGAWPKRKAMAPSQRQPLQRPSSVNVYECWE
eukprot:Protomagalhaensia_sp_Gyna_25__2829@NODE_2640_length_971_cov_146_768240_g2200_i0_p1_GENE_NODE_2640_length_971_cov_146_768240_g2200_i0NODE_2640_length_971_cov_146_768240_g2200_i0_p1_ORF_typecomplete_len210_score17_13_NODE_2640_length_971_cov_146_768240_g2200_i0150779